MDLDIAGISSVGVLNAINLFSHPVSYRIPHFQRLYCWTQEDQWEPLWRDILKTAERFHEGGLKTKAHFMGAMVTQQQASKPGMVQVSLVIDGQQRLATLQLVIKATADAVECRGLKEMANRLNKLTRNDIDYSNNDQENLVKVRQTDPGDRTAFAGVMQGGTDDGTSSSDLGKCYRYFRGEIESWLGEASQTEWRPEALEAALSQRLAIATIDLREDAEPYTIFATLNDRGVRLGPGDIIKSMLMHKAEVGNSIQKAELVWGAFIDSWWQESTRENNLERNQIDRYLDHWLTIKTGAANRKMERLPADFNDYLENHDQNEIWSTVESIRTGAKTYREIHKQELSGATRFLERMDALKIGAPMATVLWLYTNPIPQESKDLILRAIESYIIRRTLSGLTTNALRDTFAAVAAKLTNEWSPELGRDIIVLLARETPSNQKWPTDAEIREFLRTSPMKGSNKGKVVILAALEEHIRSTKAEPVGGITKLTIEHIMPKDWSTNWQLPEGTEGEKENAKVIRDRAVQFIGNLTLVTKSLNSSAKDKPWKDKRNILKEHSTLALNQDLLQKAHKVWDETTIRQRCEELSEMASQIWPDPATYKEKAQTEML